MHVQAPYKPLIVDQEPGTPGHGGKGQAFSPPLGAGHLEVGRQASRPAVEDIVPGELTWTASRMGAGWKRGAAGVKTGMSTPEL